MVASSLEKTGTPARPFPARLWQAIRGGLWRARFVLLFLLVLCVLGGGLVMTVSLGVSDVTQASLYTPDDADTLPAERYDGILILGAGLRADGSPSQMLYDRVQIGCEVYLSDPARFGKLILSGDRTGDYNEVSAMRKLALSLGVSDDDLILDYEGFSTFESISRARDVYHMERLLIVTQEYHLHRAVYIAQTLGMDAQGVIADTRPYAHPVWRSLREALARFKDFYEAGRYSGEVA